MEIGLIGCGALGGGIARAVAAGAAGPGVVIGACLVRRRLEAARAVLPPGCRLTTDPEAFFAHPGQLVVEAAGQEAVRDLGERVLRHVDLMVTSVGALADDALRTRLEQAARRHGRRIWVPSGAIAGLDGIAAAAVGRLDRVEHVTRKPPLAWKGTQAEAAVDLDGLEQPLVLYEGSPRESARRFPANVNVQTAVGLAAGDLDATRVVVVADPTVQHNTHEIRVEGEFGRLTVRVENVPTDNPKTGLLTIFAVVKALRRLQSPLFVGL